MAITPAEQYQNFVNYGLKKAKAPYDKAIVNSLMAGVWLGIYGHISTQIAGLFYNPQSIWSAGVTTLVYGAVFPGGLMFIIFTGADLFTGNVAAMTALLFEKRFQGKYWVALFKVWTISLIGNLLGCVFVAGAITLSTNAFYEGSTSYAYLQSLGEAKVSHSFGASMALAVCCNTVVCATIWAAMMSEEVIGRVVVVWFLIATFCWGKFEHSIANFYTLSAAIFCTSPNFGWSDIIVDNWIPVVIGNILGGMTFDAIIWWYAHSTNVPGLLPDPMWKEEGPKMMLDTEVSISEASASIVNIPV